jgi:hypothetical protein
MAEEPLVFISDKLSSDIGHLQTKPRHREGYGVWVTQNSPAKWKKRPLNFQALEYRRSGGGTTLVLCHFEIIGYSLRRCTRASSVVNCPWALVCLSCRAGFHA